MFGYVTANLRELTKEQQKRYGSVYCGICRRIREQAGNLARLGLSYDMAFLSLLLMSLYEPEEQSRSESCVLHPLAKRPWVDNEFIRYGADMNVALSYFNCLDDWQDDGKRTAKAMAGRMGKHLPQIERRYPRQCAAIRESIQKLGELEKANCPNPDETAGAFGALLGELFVWQEDLWSRDLRSLGDALGRFIYLLDAVQDYDKDKKKGKYNPFLAAGSGKNPQKWEEYLVLTMARCTAAFEKLPLVQDKAILDNILYSGVWVSYRNREKKEEMP